MCDFINKYCLLLLFVVSMVAKQPGALPLEGSMDPMTTGATVHKIYSWRDFVSSHSIFYFLSLRRPDRTFYICLTVLFYFVYSTPCVCFQMRRTHVCFQLRTWEIVLQLSPQVIQEGGRRRGGKNGSGKPNSPVHISYTWLLSCGLSYNTLYWKASSQHIVLWVTTAW